MMLIIWFRKLSKCTLSVTLMWCHWLEITSAYVSYSKYVFYISTHWTQNLMQHLKYDVWKIIYNSDILCGHCDGSLKSFSKQYALLALLSAWIHFDNVNWSSPSSSRTFNQWFNNSATCSAAYCVGYSATNICRSHSAGDCCSVYRCMLEAKEKNPETQTNWRKREIHQGW